MMQVSTMDVILMILGVGYGIILILSAFMSNRITESFRLDTFFIPRPTLLTKKMNLFFGLIVIAISIYSLISSYTP